MVRSKKDIDNVFKSKQKVLRRSRYKFTILSLFFLSISLSLHSPQCSASTDDTLYYITIDGNSELEAYCAGSGNGTALNPYIINGYKKEFQVGSGIQIRNTDKNLILSQVFIYRSGSYAGFPYDVGLKLENCSNILIQESIIENFDFGIILSNCSSITIIRSYLANILPNLRVEEGAHQISIHENFINGGTFGIQFLYIDPSLNTVFDNCLLDIDNAIDLFASSVQVYRNFFYNCDEIYRRIGPGQNTFTGNEENSIDDIELFQAQLNATHFQFFKENAHFPINYPTQSVSSSSTDPSSSSSSSSISTSPIGTGEMVGLFILGFVVLISVAFLISKKVSPEIKNWGLNHQWSVLFEEFNAPITEILTHYQQYRFGEALSLYRQLESNFDRRLHSKLSTFLGFTPKQLYFNLSVIQETNRIHDLIRTEEFLGAYQLIQPLLIKIDIEASGFQNPPLCKDLQSDYQFLQEIINQKHEEYAAKLSEILQIFQDQQYELAIQEFIWLKSKLEEWEFADLLIIVNKQIQILDNFRKTFQSNEGDSLSAYLEELDDDFAEWTTNEDFHRGKKQ